MTHDVESRPEREAQLLALIAQGHRIRPAARLAGIPLTTAWEIIQRANDNEQSIIPKHDEAIAQRAGEILIDMLDYMADQPPDTQWKSGFAINAIRGTAVDKIIGRQQLARPTVQVNLLVAADAMRNRYSVHEIGDGPPIEPA